MFSTSKIQAEETPRGRENLSRLSREKKTERRERRKKKLKRERENRRAREREREREETERERERERERGPPLAFALCRLLCLIRRTCFFSSFFPSLDRDSAP